MQTIFVATINVRNFERTNSHIFILSFDLKPNHLNSFSFCKEIHVRFEARKEIKLSETKQAVHKKQWYVKD